MLALKSEPTEEGLPTFVPGQAELDFWEQQAFKFTLDMDNKRPEGSGRDGRNPQRSRSVSQAPAPSGSSEGSINPTSNELEDAALLAQFSAAAGHPENWQASYEPLMQALRTLQSHPQASALPFGFPQNYLAHGQQLPSTSNVPFPWPPQMPHVNPYAAQPPMAPYNPNIFTHPFHAAQFSVPQPVAQQEGSMQTPGQVHNWPAAPSSSRSRSTSSPEATESPDAEQLTTSEDKRRRNTAASARFRIKKKQRALNLERSVSDLTGRAEELEREAADLRRENGWLKEIVMLKGRNIAATATISSQQRNPVEVDVDDDGDENSEEEDIETSEGESAGKAKGKGKERDPGNDRGEK